MMYITLNAAFGMRCASNESSGCVSCIYKDHISTISILLILKKIGSIVNVRHVVFFREKNNIGHNIFEIMLQSNDSELDIMLLKTIYSAPSLDVVAEKYPSEDDENKILITDCRDDFLNFKKNYQIQSCSVQFSIALIDPDINSRRNAFMVGFSDFLSWPILGPELYVRLLAQCRAMLSQYPQYRYSRVSLVERCCTYLVDHIAQSISVQALAQMFNTNHNTLTKQFNREMGLPPLAWQRKMRLEGAARRLLTTDAPITTIAGDFGYDSPGNFATAFRRHFGVTPLNYRKK